MVGESVAHLKAAHKEVMIDLEHFFDGYKANPEYIMQVGQMISSCCIGCDDQTDVLTVDQGCVLCLIKRARVFRDSCLLMCCGA